MVTSGHKRICTNVLAGYHIPYTNMCKNCPPHGATSPTLAIQPTPNSWDQSVNPSNAFAHHRPVWEVTTFDPWLSNQWGGMESLDAGLSGSPEKINKRRIHQTNDVITYRLIPEERAYIYLAHGEITENSMSRVPCLQKHAPPSSRASPKFSRIHNAIGHQAMQHIWLEYCQLMTGAFCCVQWLGPRIQRYIS